MKMSARFLVLLLLAHASCCFGQLAVASGENSPALARFHLVPAPKPSGVVLKRNDRLAICGDSITEQKMYSRLIEDYLTMCVPQYGVTVRQYGWSGERAGGFLGRMTNDCLRFKPTIATTCYGMNDHEYRPYEDRIGQTYLEKSTAIVRAFKANHVRVIEGSAGCVGKVPGWVKSANGTVEDLNQNLAKLRNMGVEIARREKVGFADVFAPMVAAGSEAQRLYGTNYAIAGKDGVHPGWAGHTVMAFAFLKALGLDGNIGTFIVNADKARMRTSEGHELLSAARGEYVIKSTRYPFCACEPEKQAAENYPVCEKDNLDSDGSIRSALTLVPFEPELNRLVLVVRGSSAPRLKVSWGDYSREFGREQLEKGINLAREFPENPFSAAFAKVDGAIAAKQAFETKQIKKAFRTEDAKRNMEAVVAQTEAERAALVDAVKAAFVPVTHTIRIEPGT